MKSACHIKLNIDFYPSFSFIHNICNPKISPLQIPLTFYICSSLVYSLAVLQYWYVIVSSLQFLFSQRSSENTDDAGNCKLSTGDVNNLKNGNGCLSTFNTDLWERLYVFLTHSYRDDLTAQYLDSCFETENLADNKNAVVWKKKTLTHC